MASVRKRTWKHNGVAKEAWIVDYADAGGARRQKTFDKKKDADRYRGQVEAEVEKGVHVPDSQSTTIAVLANLYFQHMDQKVADGRIGQSHALSFRLSINKNLVAHLGARKIKDISPLEVERWHKTLLQRLVPYTARMILYRVKQIEDYARKRGYTSLSVFADYCKELRGFGYKPVRTFNTEEMLRLLKAADVWEPRMQFRSHETLRCFINISAFCGLRFGEIAGLTVPNIDFGLGVIRVRHSLTILDDHKGPKTKAGVRDVPMPTHVANMLRAWLAKYYTPNDRNLVFLSKCRIGIRPGTMSISWRNVLKRAGLWNEGGDQYHFHALRHFAASWMIENGLAITDVSSLLGHSTFDQTMQTYAHPVVGGNRRQQVFQNMAERLLTAPDAIVP